MNRILLCTLKIAMLLLPLAAQSAELFKVVPEQTMRSRSASAMQALTKARAESKFTSSTVVELDRDALIGNLISITLPGIETVTIPKRSEKALEGGKVVWEGRDSASASTFFGVLSADGLRGNFYLAKHGMFFIEPFDGKLHIVGKREPMATHPPGYDKRPLRQVDPSSQSSLSSRDASPLAAAGKTVIDVVVFFAPEVGQTGVNTYVPNAIAEANSHFTNSLLDVELRLVGTRPYPHTIVHYDISLTLDGMLGSSQVTSTMDALGADVALLIVPSNGECGITDIGPARAIARSVMTLECLRFEKGISHEVGHMMGAGHDSGAPGPWRYSYGRAYFGLGGPGGCIRTILAYYRPCSAFYVAHVPYFSSPTVRIGSTPYGSATEDNTRVIREQAATVAAFRAPVVSGPGGPGGPSPQERARAIIPILTEFLLSS